MLRVILRDSYLKVTGKFCVWGLSQMSVLILKATLLHEALCQGFLVSPVLIEDSIYPCGL